MAVVQFRDPVAGIDVTRTFLIPRKGVTDVMRWFKSAQACIPDIPKVQLALGCTNETGWTIIEADATLDIVKFTLQYTVGDRRRAYVLIDRRTSAFVA